VAKGWNRAARAYAQACQPLRVQAHALTTRRASSILKALSPNGFASASAALAARCENSAVVRPARRLKSALLRALATVFEATPAERNTRLVR